MRGRESRPVVTVSVLRGFKPWHRMAVVGNANLLNLRFHKCFHHRLFSLYVIFQEIVRAQFGECWLNSYSFFFFYVFSLSLYIFLPLRFSIPITQQGITITNRGTCKLSDNGQFSRSINEQVFHGSQVYAEQSGLSHQPALHHNALFLLHQEKICERAV